MCIAKDYRLCVKTCKNLYEEGLRRAKVNNINLCFFVH